MNRRSFLKTLLGVVAAPMAAVAAFRPKPAQADTTPWLMGEEQARWLKWEKGEHAIASFPEPTMVVDDAARITHSTYALCFKASPEMLDDFPVSHAGRMVERERQRAMNQWMRDLADDAFRRNA